MSETPQDWPATRRAEIGASEIPVADPLRLYLAARQLDGEPRE